MLYNEDGLDPIDIEEELTDEEEFDMLSEAEQQEIEQREVFNDRYDAWRNEY